MGRLNQITGAALAILVIVGFFSTLFYVLVKGFPEAASGEQILYIMFGNLGTAFGTVLNAYFQNHDKRALRAGDLTTLPESKGVGS